MMNGDNEVEGKNQASIPKWVLLAVIIIGAVAGIIGGYVRNEYLYGELSIGFSDVLAYFCPFYFVFAGIIAAVIGHFLLNLIDKDRRVPVYARLFLSAILGFIAGFLVVSDWWFPP